MSARSESLARAVRTTRREAFPPVKRPCDSQGGQRELATNHDRRDFERAFGKAAKRRVTLNQTIGGNKRPPPSFATLPFGPIGQFFVFLGNALHSLPGLGIGHILGFGARLLRFVAPMFRIVETLRIWWRDVF